MLVLDQLTRLSANEILCRITLEATPLEFKVRLTQPDDGLRGMNFEGMPPRLSWELSNCDEFRAFMKTIWAYVDGASLILPKEIVPDWSPEKAASR
jgi:hypothetical protein